MQSDSLYRLTAACLITHELESILIRQWDTFSVVDTTIDQIILLAHIPVVLALLVAAEFTRSARMRLFVCAFATLHAGLHWLYRNDPLHDFASITSWVLILLAGVCGAVYLVPQKAR